MSFWESQPVKISKNIDEIFSNEKLLYKISNELEKYNPKLSYNTIFGKDISNDKQTEILNFLNQNYIYMNDMSFLYSNSLFSYVIRDSIIIEFLYDTKCIGIIIGLRKKIIIKKEILEITEVDFLSLSPAFRNLKLAPQMIQILTLESIKNFGIHRAYYTISNPIKSECFGTKRMFHRPINAKILFECGFFSKPITQPKFHNLRKLEYINGINNNELAKNITYKLSEYSKKTYDIFDCKTQTDIQDILANKSFHNFLFYNNHLTDFISLFEIESKNMVKQKSFRNGTLFAMFLSETNVCSISKIIDSIAAYCLEHNILDVITFGDIFKVLDYKQLGCVNGTGILRYYMFNQAIPPIENTRNGLMTI